MKNTWNRIKQFFTFPVVRPYWRAGDGFAETVVDLNSQEKDYINTQTRRFAATQTRTSLQPKRTAKLGKITARLTRLRQRLRNIQFALKKRPFGRCTD